MITFWGAFLVLGLSDNGSFRNWAFLTLIRLLQYLNFLFRVDTGCRDIAVALPGMYETHSNSFTIRPGPPATTAGTHRCLHNLRYKLLSI